MSTEASQRFDIGLQRDQLDRQPVIEPSFVRDGIPYYTEMPARPTEKPRLTILSLDDADVRNFVEASYAAQNEADGKNRKLGWIVSEQGIKNPGYGSYEHGVYITYDADGNWTQAQHDTITWSDGPIDARTGLPTSGSVIAPIEKVIRDDGTEEYYVHAFWQYRPAFYDDANTQVPEDITDPVQIRDFLALNRGEWVATTPGGFADYVGESPESIAIREAVEEGRLIVSEPELVKRNMNRANIVNSLNVGFGTFVKNLGAPVPYKEPKDSEVIKGRMAVRIDKFESEDGIVVLSIDSALRKLGLISASPQATQKK